MRRHPEPPIGGAELVVGFVASADGRLFAVRFLLRYLKTRTLKPFGVYLGLLGATLLLWSFAKGSPLPAG